MSLAVTKTSRTLVRPRETTPCGTLPLSPLDKVPSNTGVVDMLFVYNHGRESTKVIRGALSQALIHYYPLAGRLVVLEGNDIEVDCTGDGVWYVEASADCSLDDVNYLEHPLMISEQDILPYSPQNIHTHNAILMVQVTEFTCGGFAIGCLFQHALLDSVGLARFLKAVGELARGLTRPTVDPIWCRDAIPVRPGPPPAKTTGAQRHLHLEYSTIDIPLPYINHLQNQFTEEMGKRCSTFDVISALVWQCRTRAVDSDPQADVHFGFPVDVRPLLHHVLLPSDPGGYYGNGIFNMITTAPSWKITAGSIIEIISLIRDAKERVPAEFWKWIRGEITEDPLQNKSLYQILAISDLRMVGYSEMDFGWGGPIRWCALTRNDFIPSCLIVKSREEKQNAKLAGRVLRKGHLPAFDDQLMSLTHNHRPRL